MAEILMNNASYALTPEEDVDYSISGYEYPIEAGENWNAYFFTGTDRPSFTLQVSWSGIDGTGTLALSSSVNGTDYDNLVDDDGTAVTISVTGATGTYTLHDTVAPFGKVKINYAKGTNSAGLISLNVRY